MIDKITDKMGLNFSHSLRKDIDDIDDTDARASCSFDVTSSLKTVDYESIYINKGIESPIIKYFNDIPTVKSVVYHETSEHLYGKMSQAFDNGFFNAILIAYSYHIPLTLSPDNFWFQIIQEVSRHININSRKFKSHFVDSKSTDKIEIVVDITLSKSYSDGIRQIVESIRQNLKDDTFVSLCIKPFTTTTPLIQTCYGSVLMNSMESYFSYSMEMLCGIKHVTLNGKLVDWLDLVKRIEILKTMPYTKGIERNLDNMIIRLRQIINCYRGFVDKNFWNSIVNVVAHGSGSTICNGWITDFFIYDIKDRIIENNTPRNIFLNSIPLGYSGTPFVLDGQKMMLYSGQSGVQILEDKSITPSFINVVAIERT